MSRETRLALGLVILAGIVFITTANDRKRMTRLEREVNYLTAKRHIGMASEAGGTYLNERFIHE